MKNSRILANFECFRKHEEVKKADRIRKESKARKFLDADNQVSRFYFKISVVKSSLYICVVCNWCLYRRSVGLFNGDKLSVSSDDVFRFASSFDGNFYICKACRKKLNKKFFTMSGSLQHVCGL